MEMHLHNTGPRRRKWEASHAPWFFVYKAIYIYLDKTEGRRQKTAQEAGKCNPSQAEQTSGERWKRTLQCIGYGKWQQLATVQRADEEGARLSEQRITPSGCTYAGRGRGGAPPHPPPHRHRRRCFKILSSIIAGLEPATSKDGQHNR